MAKKTATLDRVIRKQWNIPGLVSDLKGETWQITEKNRIDRRIYLASYNNIAALAEESVSKKEWKDAEADGFEHEIVEEYLERLAEIVKDKMGEHVYGEMYEGDCFLGQYEDGNIEKLREDHEIEE